MEKKLYDIDNMDDYYVCLTPHFIAHVVQFVHECEAKRKEILDAEKDTADDTTLPTLDDIVSDVLYGGLVDEDNEYYNYWGVTDNYDSDYPFSCRVYVDDNDKKITLAAI